VKRIIIELCSLAIFVFIFFGLVLPEGYNSKVDAIVIVSQISTIILIGYSIYCIYRIIKLIIRRIEE
jgi:hypothetical protein